MTYLLIFFTSLILTIFLTPYYISFLKKSRIIDYPGARKVHKEIMPRMGGLIIFFVVLILLNAFVEDFNTIKLLIISSTILIFTGIVDDVIGLNNFIKFIFQNISAVILVLFLQKYYSSVSILGITLTHPIDYLVILLFIVGTINSINFLDGLDGLASGFSILIFGSILALSINKDDVFLILLTVCLLGSTIGFLRFNAFPARVFLGDTGSLILGFFLVLTSSLTSIDYHEKVLDLNFPIILLGLPLIDAVKVFVLRLIKKRDPFSPDTSHQHHILKKSIVSHEATVFFIQLISLYFIFLSLLYLKDYRTQVIIIYFISAIIVIGLHPILLRFSVAHIADELLIKLRQIPIKNIFKIINFSLFIAFILMLVVIILSFSFNTSLSIQELLFLLIMVTGLLLIAILQSKKIGSVGGINVFLNFAIFFIISKLSLPSLYNDELTIKTISQVNDITFYALSTIIAITLVLRWKALMTKTSLFTGADLTIIVLMMLTFIVNNFLKYDLHYYLSISLLEAFIFYIWYKLIVDLRKKYEHRLAIASFILPLSLLITLIISSQL